MSKLAEIEALLFVAGEDGLKVHQLAEILSLPPTGVIQSLEKLAEQYEANPDSSLTLLETSKTYKLDRFAEGDAVKAVVPKQSRFLFLYGFGNAVFDLC